MTFCLQENVDIYQCNSVRENVATMFFESNNAETKIKMDIELGQEMNGRI
jgi:hypothetical protein